MNGRARGGVYFCVWLRSTEFVHSRLSRSGLVATEEHTRGQRIVVAALTSPPSPVMVEGVVAA